MEHSLHGDPFLSGTHSRCHGCVPVKVDGCFDDHEQTGTENVDFHLKDTYFTDSCKDFGPYFCLTVSFPILSY